MIHTNVYIVYVYIAIWREILSQSDDMKALTSSRKNNKNNFFHRLLTNSSKINHLDDVSFNYHLRWWICDSSCGLISDHYYRYHFIHMLTFECLFVRKVYYPFTLASIHYHFHWLIELIMPQEAIKPEEL